MMDSWRRQGDNYNQEVTRARSNYKKPPLGSWQPTVPSWEKKFCTSVGSVPWRKIVETKRCMHLYDNVVKWNDSAGEEAFRNAKNRFYAYVHGLPCDISLPDPDMYIDETDWDSKIDPNLILDLECEAVVPDANDNNERVVIFGDSLLSNQGFSSTGWGDCEEDIKKATNSSSENNDNFWDGNHCQNNGAVEGNEWGGFDNNNSYCWNVNNGAKGDGWNSGWGDGWNQYEHNNYVPEDVDGCIVEGWRDVNTGRREGTGRYMSSYKTSRFRGDDYQRHHSWRNGSGRKRVNLVSEQPITDKNPASRPWKMMNSCAPVGHHAKSEMDGVGRNQFLKL